ncbi:cysteine desulfurase [Sphingobium sufflavum]|uniref:cysteine desulfurase family protein n=1 Tax=Sphingobium sufflavum TaxID=1129547 RepID=UPI001F3B23AB|nr:cysteine desulfurase family protein [Sphingobium sufflavum]MCE7797491.1 cysteine desulfurase [Sphingobium sufflavum]
MIYLDYQATTPLAPEVIAVMADGLHRHGNPHSAHAMGRQAAAEVELARDRVHRTLGLGGGRLVFTSGATEALNTAIQGMAQGAAGGGRTRIVTLATEHAAVIDTALACARWGMEAVLLPVGPDGLVDLNRAAEVIDDSTALLVAMQVNNEIGVIQPLEALAALAARVGAPFLCDAVQGFGRLALPVTPDMVAISAHKVHGPKGIGALWLRDGLSLPPLMHGGGQEGGVRSGTLSPLLCAGFGVAAKVADERRAEDAAHVAALWETARRLFAGWTVNGGTEHRYRGNLNIRRDGVDAARILSSCRRVAMSLGSACASGSGRTSHVLRAIGLTDAQARSSIRLGFGRYTTMSDVEEGALLILESASEQEPMA